MTAPGAAVPTGRTSGHRLAMLHRADCSAFVPDGESGMKYGFTEDNYIGASPQKNIPGRKWADFYRDCRLLPQIKMAERYFDSGLLKKADYLLDHLIPASESRNFHRCSMEISGAAM